MKGYGSEWFGKRDPGSEYDDEGEAIPRRREGGKEGRGPSINDVNV